MNDLRPTSPHQRRMIKATVRRTLEMAGGVTSFEHVTRVKAPALSKYGSPEDPAHMPVDVVMDLMIDTRSVGILSYLAGELGFKLLALDAQALGGAMPDMRDISGLVKDYSKLIDDVTHAVADGDISAPEEREISDDIERAITDLRALQRKVKAAVKGGAV